MENVSFSFLENLFDFPKIKKHPCCSYMNKNTIEKFLFIFFFNKLVFS